MLLTHHEKSGSATESDSLETLEALLTEYSKRLGFYCPGEIPDIGGILEILIQMMEKSIAIFPQTFYQISAVSKHYVDNLTLENMHHIHPLEEGVVLLRSLLSHMKKGQEFMYDYKDVLNLMQGNAVNNDILFPETDAQPRDAATHPPKDNNPIGTDPKVHKKISQDDMEILIDFISEAEESLDSIEISLIDLEQDPTNIDIINDIFRPFHTIKGVSGFLSLTKINQLAHTTENLLDSARSGDFVIESVSTDAILASVDLLKKLIEKARQGTQAGVYLPDDDIPVEALCQKLEQLQAHLSQSEHPPLGEILVKNKAIDKKTLDAALETQRTLPDKKIGEILIEKEQLQPSQVASALMEQSHTPKRVDSQVKVSTQKLDDLVDYAGELVIAQSMLRQKTSANPELSQNVAQLGQIVNNMQMIAMSMRMIPIKATFMKMIRLVRDLSKRSGKNVALSMQGEDTEIDRNVVDALYEPMVHMIRNSVDHGIEPSGTRSASGKTDQGNIYLRAFHKGGNIVIEIEDDGKGLDKEKILKKAMDAGLISRNDKPTETQIFNMIMHPGFSTAEKITDVSGRGVGMDVVKEGIEKFRGHLNIHSEKEKGTRFTIALPLTLAIIDGMLVRVENERYVIPTTAVQRAFRPAPNEYFTVEGKGEMIKNGGHLIPLIRLNQMYQISCNATDIQASLVVIVESKDEKRAILIDELLGKDEFVIKNLGGSLEDIKGIAGGAILADGRVGLILDIHGIFSLALEENTAPLSSRLGRC